MEDLRRRYGDRVEFLGVYVREAHPTDGWREPGNDRVGISIPQPKFMDERVNVAQKCCARLEINMPLLVDAMDDRVGHLYSGMPDRLYVIDREGRVAYKGGRGPFGFKSREMEQSLVMLLLDEASKTRESSRRAALPTSAEAWEMLPKAAAGGGQPLPTWARALAPSLPHTAVALLSLDYLHRERSPLEPHLRGMIRWTAADANRCQYSQAYALADLRRAGIPENTIWALIAGDESAFSTKERAVLAFARKLTLQADAITDDEVAQVIKQYGEKQVVAVVLLLAYANFQDRLLLSLALPLEATGPLPPLELRFTTEPSMQLPQRPPFPNRDAAPAAAERVADPEWAKINFEQLQKALAGQRARKARIALRDWEEVKKNLPREYQKRDKPSIRWSLVCMSYQPELTAAWFNGMGAFGAESRQDHVLEESLFWVITRTVNCFY